MTFAEKLQMLRKERGLSQDQLASALEVSRQSVSKWELGNDMPKVDKILLLSDFFDVSADYLLRDDRSETSAAAEMPEAAPPQKEKRMRLLFTALLAAACILLFYVFLKSPILPLILIPVTLQYLLPACAIACIVYLAVRAALKKQHEKPRE